MDGLCDGPIPRPEESYRLWCIIVCNLETSRMRRPWPALGCCATKENVIHDRTDNDELITSCLYSASTRIATNWADRRSNPGGGKIFRTRANRLWDPPSFVHNEYRATPGGNVAWGLALTTHPHLAPRLKKE